MLKLIRLVATVLGLAVVFAALADVGPGPWDSTLTVLDMPVVSVRPNGAHGWLAIGQTATGVLVLAQGGGGLVTFAQGGVGVIFGIGQGMVGLLVPLAQLGVGLFYFTGQVGFGMQARGQGVLLRRSTEYFAELHDELGEMLS